MKIDVLRYAVMDDPLIIAGSANFSKPSQRINDENMLVIHSDKLSGRYLFW